jgi:hypothetical protein
VKTQTSDSEEKIKEVYKHGHYTVTASYRCEDGHKRKNPSSIIITGPNDYKMNVNGHDSLENANKLAKLLDEHDKLNSVKKEIKN